MGYHPLRWRETIACIIPKLNRTDYTLPKNFRPISLLECLGKLLEKVIALLIYKDMAKHTLVPTNQFGGHNASSTADAGLMLLHNIQSAHQAGLKSGLLLFDILGFFDNVNHNRLMQIIENLPQRSSTGADLSLRIEQLDSDSTDKLPTPLSSQ